MVLNGYVTVVSGIGVSYEFVMYGLPLGSMSLQKNESVLFLTVVI